MRPRHRHVLLHAPLPHLAAVLEHLLTLLRRGVVPAVAQLLALTGRQLLKAVEILAHSRLLSRRQCLKLLPALAQLLTLLGREGVPLLEALAGQPFLLWRHPQPTLTSACERLLSLGGECVPLSSEARE